MRNRSKKLLTTLLIFTLVVGLFGSINKPIIASSIIQAVDLSGTSYTQNFDSLANSGTSTWTNDSNITGWYLITDLTNPVITYVAGLGSENSGAFYSYGSSGSTERALGGLGSNSYYGSSGSGKGHIGLVIHNNTGENISQIAISYFGEQWRANNTATQSLTFTYKSLTAAPTDASVFASTTTDWTAVTGLNFSSPINTTSSPQAKDGNLAANRLAVSSTISGLTISPGNYLLLRWTDLNDSGNDHGLAIDDLSITFTTSAVDTAPSVSSTTPANSATDVAIDSNITITFNEAVNTTGTWFTISCGTSSTHTAAVSGGPTTFTLNPDTDFANSETCDVTVVATAITDQDTDDPPDAMAADYLFSFATEAPAAPPTLVINEIDYDQPSTDTAEFIEIKNVSTAAIDLSGHSIRIVNGDGGGATVVQSIDLPATSLAAGDYFVVCANSGNTANCDMDVTPDSNLIQNGAPDAVAIVLGTTIVDTVSYEGNTGAPYTEGSGAGLADAGATGSISRCPDGIDTNSNNVDLKYTPAKTPGYTNDCGALVDEACGDPFTPIYSVQGDGLSSPIAETTVSVQGVVVGDFQNNASADNGELNGFHLQDPNGDGNVLTSDGIFILAPGAIDVAAGDAVRVRGYVSEYYGMTEITASQVWVCSSGNSVALSDLSLPVESVDDFEPYEGMLVRFLQPLTISEYFNYDQFGEIVLATYRHVTPTALAEPGSPWIADMAQEYLLERITLDDGRSEQNPDPAIHPNGLDFTLSNRFRGGDLLWDVTGVLEYGFGQYRIQPTTAAVYTENNPRPDQPPAVGGSLKVVSMNVLNYFTTLGSRGANTPEEFTRQRDKIITAIVKMNPDIAGLVEIENNDTALANLVQGLNDATAPGTYAYIPTGTIGTDEIKVALIYKPATVSPMGAYAILDSSIDARFLDDYNRPVLAQTFMASATGGVFTVAVNHLKSKGSDCNDVGDPDTGDGSGNCNLTRLEAARAEVDWLATDPTGSNDTDFMIIGDLNSYDKEDPIDAIMAGADDDEGTADDFVDMLYTYQGEEAYTYVFDGQIGYLDYAASKSLAAQITGVDAWHVNADEPDLIDYDMTFKKDAQDALYAPDEFRYSDHDPVLVGLNLVKTGGAVVKPEEKSTEAEEKTETPTTLPDTGFAPGRITALPQQAVEYSELGDLWLEIPALGVKTAITGVPVTNGSWDVTWLGSQAGWLEGSAFPTASGNAVLTGHVWDALNRPGVFERLTDLRFGDQVIVHNAGKAYVYEVRERLQISADRVNQLLKHKDRSWVTLVTCRGFDEESGDYLSRLLVRAVLVEVK